jgi:hypothetical protein
MSACQATALLVAEFIRAGVSLRFGDAENSPLGIAGGEPTEAPAGLVSETMALMYASEER